MSHQAAPGLALTFKRFSPYNFTGSQCPCRVSCDSQRPFCTQVHKLFRREAQSHGPDTGPVGGQAPGTDVRHGPVERSKADGPNGRGVVAGTRTRPVAMSSSSSNDTVVGSRVRHYQQQFLRRILIINVFFYFHPWQTFYFLCLFVTNFYHFVTILRYFNCTFSFIFFKNKL